MVHIFNKLYHITSYAVISNSSCQTNPPIFLLESFTQTKTSTFLLTHGGASEIWMFGLWMHGRQF